MQIKNLHIGVIEPPQSVKFSLERNVLIEKNSFLNFKNFIEDYNQKNETHQKLISNYIKSGNYIWTINPNDLSIQRFTVEHTPEERFIYLYDRRRANFPLHKLHRFSLADFLQKANEFYTIYIEGLRQYRYVCTSERNVLKTVQHIIESITSVKPKHNLSNKKFILQEEYHKKLIKLSKDIEYYLRAS